MTLHSLDNNKRTQQALKSVFHGCSVGYCSCCYCIPKKSVQLLPEIVGGLEDFFLVNCTKYNVKSFSTQRENWDFL